MERYTDGKREVDRPTEYDAKRSSRGDDCAHERGARDRDGDWKHKLDGPLSRLLGVDEHDQWS